MIILHVCESVKGGISTYLNLLLMGFNEKGIENLVLLPKSDENLIKQTEAKKILFRQSRNTLGLIRFYIALSNVMRESTPDIVYAHSTFSGIIVSIYKIFHPSTKVIYCSHGWSVFRSQNFIKKFIIYSIEFFLSRIPNVIVNISRYEHSITRFIGYSKKSILIENSVSDLKYNKDFSPRLNDSDFYLNLLFVGRFDEQKGVDILLDALDEYNHEFSKKIIKLYLIGDYVLEEKENLQLDKYWIERIGWVDNDLLDYYYSKADFLVVPSRWEGFGLVVLEAYRNSLPVLASTSGALPFIVDDFITGRLFEPNKEDLKSTLSTLSTLSKSYRDEMSVNAFKKYKKQFSCERFIEKQYNCVKKLFNE